MTGRVDATLAKLNIQLPEPPKPVASYVPFVISGNLVFLSGQVSIAPSGERVTGIVGKDVDVEHAQKGARVCAINLLAQLKLACGGDLDRVRRCVKVTGFVNAAPGFGDQPTVINGASDVFVSVFGDEGRHARAAVGAGSLPHNVSVEVDAVFEIH